MGNLLHLETAGHFLPWCCMYNVPGTDYLPQPMPIKSPPFSRLQPTCPTRRTHPSTTPPPDDLNH